MSNPDFTKVGGDWSESPPRVVVTLNEHGEFDGIAADCEIIAIIAQPSCINDRNYRYRSIDVGPDAVSTALGGVPVHDDDAHPRPKLALVPK